MRLTKQLQTSIFLSLLGILALSLHSCKKKASTADNSEDLQAYVYAYTAGVISRNMPIRVRFIDPPISEDQVGAEAEAKIFQFSPSIAGEARWEDQNTLRFYPSEWLPSNQSYTATVKVNKVFTKVPSNSKTFTFNFQTKEQYFNIFLEGLQVVELSDLSKQQLEGKIRTADLAKSASVEKILKARQNGKDLPIEWIHETDQINHTFIIKDIERGQNESTVELSWDGDPLDVDISNKRDVTVPALDDFKITDAYVVQEQEQYVVLQFSDPLLESQDLEGLITIKGFNGNFRTIINGQKLRIYPSRRILGTQTIIANSGIRNTNNNRMRNPSEWKIQFEDVKPQVRLVGKGVILPNSEGLVFPFEAVSLNAIELEVFKIYNNNILQFLQTNQLDGNYDLNRVGRIILQEKIDLNKLDPDANVTSWARYGIDLSTLIQPDPGAIYQVRIGFKPSYASYYCANQIAQEATLSTVEEETQDGQPISIMNRWYGFDGYYPDYNWDHREDPCYSAYYNSERFIQRNILASNLGIIAKAGKDNQYFVSVTDLTSTKGLSGVQLEFYDYQQQLIKSGSTGSDGSATLSIDRPPFAIVAKQGNQMGYLRIQDGNALSLSRFDVAGTATKKGLKGYLYGERGVWRPGDSLYLNFVLEDQLKKLPNKYPITFELYNPKGQLQERITKSNHINGVYALHTATERDAPTGSWRARVLAGGASFERLLKIETIKPNRLKIELELGEEDLSVADEPFRTEMQVNWLHGAPASNLRASLEVQLMTANTRFAKYPSFEFEDPARKFYTDPSVLFDGQLDENGKASVQSTLLNNPKVPGKLLAKFKARAFENGGNFSTYNFSKTYHPYKGYTGIEIPKNQYGSKQFDIDKEGTFRFVSLDTEGNPQSNQSLNVGLYKVNWRWWWDRSNDGVSRYNSSEHRNAMESAKLTTNSNGEAEWSAEVKEWGRYMIRVCDTETGHCSGDFFYAGYPWNGDDNFNRQEAAMLAFTSDKETYQVGEMVKLKVPGSDVGRALITIENGTNIVESFWADTQPGENTFTFRTTSEMAPNVYAHVAMIQPHGQVKNDLPIRMYGVIPVEVEDPDTHLKPKLSMPDELKPEQTITVEVSEESGKPMAYTVALVDEGLLSLTNFKTPNPWNVFYAREALGVKTWDVFDQVLGAYGGELERLLSIGGDAELAPAAVEESADRFKPVVRHLGPFYLEKGQKAKHEIQIPNYVGAVRTMVVASNQGAYGSVGKSTPVKKPLMVLATLPRVLGPGEQLQLPVNVFAMDDKIKRANIKVEETSGLVDIIGSSSQNLQFARTGEKMAYFDIKVKERIGVARFKVSASGNGENSSEEIEIQIRNPNPVVTTVMDQVIDPNGNWTLPIIPVGMQGTNEAYLEVSSIPPLDLGRRLNYLIRYPYGCVEQTLSGAFPQLYLDKLVDLNNQQQSDIPENITVAINRLRQFQTPQGGFGYWPGNARADDWSTSYAGHFLVEAQTLGYSLPPALLDKWVSYQQSAARQWSPQSADQSYRRGNHMTQAYRLYTLALAQKPDLGSMNRLREVNNLVPQAKWLLAGAYALAGKPDVSKQLINQAPTSFDAYRELSYTYGSGLRDEAIVLEVLTLLDDRNKAAPVVKEISEELNSGRWYSTQTISWALMAVGKFSGKMNEQEEITFTFKQHQGQTVNAGTKKPMMQIQVPIDGEANPSIEVQNTTNSILFGRLILSGQPLTGLETSEAKDLQLAVTYTDLNGNTIDPSRLTQGTDFVAEIQVSHPGTRSMWFMEMALTQIFPSGWEILNTRMDELVNFSQGTRPEYQDFRDDRVNTFFDINRNQTHTYRVQLNAAYQGRFYLPAVSCEAMYDDAIYARQAGQWVEVVQ